MNGDAASSELTSRQVRAIPYLVAAPSIEAGCREAKISKATLYSWLREEAFKLELKRQRDEVIRGALENLKASTAKATATLVKLLDSDKESIQVRAAEDTIQFTQKAIELETLEQRIEELEKRIRERKG